MHVISIARGNKNRFPAAAVFPNSRHIWNFEKENERRASRRWKMPRACRRYYPFVECFVFVLRFSVSRLLPTLPCRRSKTRYRCCFELFCYPTFTLRLPFVLHTRWPRLLQGYKVEVINRSNRIYPKRNTAFFAYAITAGQVHLGLLMMILGNEHRPLCTIVRHKNNTYTCVCDASRTISRYLRVMRLVERRGYTFALFPSS